MTTLVADSKARCLENQRLLARSRLLIARSRRLLNPAFEIAGGSRGSNENLRQTIRIRLATGALFRVDGKVYAGKGTGKPCTLCGIPISQGDIEHEVVGPTTVFSHWDCYSIWRQESDALARTPQESRQHSVKAPTPLHIEREDGEGIHPPTAEYAVAFGGSKDRAGTMLLGRPQGLDALTVLLRSLGIAADEIETACQVLTEQSHYVIPDVSLTPLVLRRFRI
jgi:hypothetical protein